MAGQIVRRIGILVTGRPSTELMAEHGDYFTMFSQLLASSPDSKHRLEFQRFTLEDGEDAAPTDIDSFDGFLITGSKHDAHDLSKPWINDLHEFVRVAHARQTLLLGICFGHQLIAAALGGRTGRADAVGWEIGVRHIQPRADWLEANPAAQFGQSIKSLSISESHRDQVLELPPDAEWVAESPRCPFEMFTVKPNVLCIQGHPEFSPSFLSGLIKARRALNSFDETVATEALASVAGIPTSKSYFQDLMYNFLLGNGCRF